MRYTKLKSAINCQSLFLQRYSAWTQTPLTPVHRKGCQCQGYCAKCDATYNCAHACLSHQDWRKGLIFVLLWLWVEREIRYFCRSISYLFFSSKIIKIKMAERQITWRCDSGTQGQWLGISPVVVDGNYAKKVMDFLTSRFGDCVFTCEPHMCGKRLCMINALRILYANWMAYTPHLISGLRRVALSFCKYNLGCTWYCFNLLETSNIKTDLDLQIR